jgi:hypothetical protein
MTDDQLFLQEIRCVLKSSVEVEDWVSIKELIHEISDFLGQETEDDEYDDFVDD